MTQNFLSLGTPTERRRSGMKLSFWSANALQFPQEHVVLLYPATIVCALPETDPV